MQSRSVTSLPVERVRLSRQPGLPAPPALAAEPDDVATPDLRHLDSNPRFRGGIDWFRDGVLSGWAIDLAHPTEPVPLTLVSSGAVMAITQTSIGRADLQPFVRDNIAGFWIEPGMWDLPT